MRQRNNLPSNNGGFGFPSVTTHLHNGHTPLESDGFPCFFFAQGQFYDYHYPNVYAGVNSTRPGTGDIKEAMHTLWYHDHRIDHTAENTYKGLQALTFSLTSSTLVTKTPASVYRASATVKTR